MRGVIGPAVLLLAAAAPAMGWDAARLAVPVVIDQHTIPYPEFAIYVMPGQQFQVSLRDASDGGTVRFLGRSESAGEVTLRAPQQSGINRLEVENVASGEIAVVNVFTLVPSRKTDARGFLDGYRIGHYPEQPLRGQAIYQPPAGYIQVTADNADIRVSPNFRLGQFVSKQTSGYPKYLLLRASLLLKLENILTTLNQRGHPTQGLVIMSGYRTPFYNKAIGNVAYSRHVWGGAADFYIDDSPADGRMDDLNGDGRVDRNDARWLADFVNGMSQRGAFESRIGGLGVYGSNAAHGPFIHVDVRGTRARW